MLVLTERAVDSAGREWHGDMFRRACWLEPCYCRYRARGGLENTCLGVTSDLVGVNGHGSGDHSTSTIVRRLWCSGVPRCVSVCRRTTMCECLSTYHLLYGTLSLYNESRTSSAALAPSEVLNAHMSCAPVRVMYLGHRVWRSSCHG